MVAGGDVLRDRHLLVRHVAVLVRLERPDLHGIAPNLDRPDLLGNPYLPSDRSKGDRIARWFDASAFRQNNPGTFGNVGRNLLEGPGKAAREPYLLPLPHPSGASRWLNQARHRELLQGALELLARTWPSLVDPAHPAATRGR